MYYNVLLLFVYLASSGKGAVVISVPSPSLYPLRVLANSVVTHYRHLPLRSWL